MLNRTGRTVRCWSLPQETDAEKIAPIRSERLLMEELQYNLLFGWFVGLNMDDEMWVPTVFSKNRDRLLQCDVVNAFFDAIWAEAKARDLLSDKHFTVDGTLLEDWASQRSFKKKGPAALAPDDAGNPTVDFTTRNGALPRTNHDRSRHAADPQGPRQEAKLCYVGHLLIENRNGLIVNARLKAATGTAEREARADNGVKSIPGGNLGCGRRAHDGLDAYHAGPGRKTEGGPNLQRLCPARTVGR